MKVELADTHLCGELTKYGTEIEILGNTTHPTAVLVSHSPDLELGPISKLRTPGSQTITLPKKSSIGVLSP